MQRCAVQQCRELQTLGQGTHGCAKGDEVHKDALTAFDFGFSYVASAVAVKTLDETYSAVLAIIFPFR